MPFTVTLNLSDNQGQKASINVEKESIIKDIFTTYKERTLTTQQYNQLQQIASYAGDIGVLEEADIANGKNRLKANILKGNSRIVGQLENLLQLNPFRTDISVKIPAGTSMASIKAMYNLPDGSLRNFLTGRTSGGNMDRETLEEDTWVWFSIQDFAKGNNMTVDEVKELFK